METSLQPNQSNHAITEDCLAKNLQESLNILHAHIHTHSNLERVEAYQRPEKELRRYLPVKQNWKSAESPEATFYSNARRGAAISKHGLDLAVIRMISQCYALLVFTIYSLSYARLTHFF